MHMVVTVGWFVASAIVLIGGIVALRKLTKSAPRGMCFLLAALVWWLVAEVMPRPTVPGLLMLKGVVQLTASLGLVAGLIDILRKRTPGGGSRDII